jgi:pyruvate kinase
VNSFYYNNHVSTDETVEDVNQITIEKGYTKQGDFLINLAAMPMKDEGMVNTLRLSQI